MGFLQVSVLILVALLALTSAQSDGTSYVVHSLNNFQAVDGGFAAREGSEQGDLRNTADASILVALYGLSSKVSVSGASHFIADLENSDGGYASSAGLGSSIQATLDAVVAQKNLEIPFSDAVKTAAFVKSLFDGSSGLFSGVAGGGKGDIKSTALALQALDTIGHLNSVSSLFPAIRDYLSRNVRSQDHFAFASDRVSGENNYWGIVAGSYVGFDFGARKQWAARIQSLQNPTGGIAAVEGTAVSLETTAHAVHALNLLVGNVPESVVEAAARYASEAPRGVRPVSLAHVIALITGEAHRSFRVVPLLERADGSPVATQIVQGTAFRVVVRVENSFAVGGGASVSGSATFGSEAPVTLSLAYNSERKVYVSSDLLDSENRLGPVKFAFEVLRSVAPYPSLSLKTSLERSVGYGINVQSSAKLDVTGRDIAEGETVSIGTEFKFDVSLYRSDRKRFTSGDFQISLVVRDSSRVVLHKESISGKSANEIIFSYTLSKSNLPPPRILFVFEVASQGITHTVHEVSYLLGSQAVAANIKLFKQDIKIGQTEVITIQPSVLLQSGSVQPIDYDESRKFFLDLRSKVGGAVVRSIPAVVAKDTATFTIQLNPVLESLGRHFVSFRYQAADGTSVDLKNYDSNLGEVVETAASFTVAAKLVLSDVSSQPQAGDFFYGNEVSFIFKVKDSVSGKYLTRGDSSEESNVFLLLQHTQGGSPAFTSATVPASYAEDSFIINWKITPNAVRGPGILVLSARGADGKDIPLSDAEGKEYRLNINVGGDIDVKKNTYSTNNPDTAQTAIVATFSLSCRGNPLDNAELVANLRVGSKEIARNLQVSSSSDGLYEVSWNGPHKSAPQGHYTLDVFRETDKARVVESKGAITLEPLFSVELDHEGIGSSEFPIAPEIIIVVLLGIGTVFASLSLQKVLA